MQAAKKCGAVTSSLDKDVGTSAAPDDAGAATKEREVQLARAHKRAKRTLKGVWRTIVLFVIDHGGVVTEAAMTQATRVGQPLFDARRQVRQLFDGDAVYHRNLKHCLAVKRDGGVTVHITDSLLGNQVRVDPLAGVGVELRDGAAPGAEPAVVPAAAVAPPDGEYLHKVIDLVVELPSAYELAPYRDSLGAAGVQLCVPLTVIKSQSCAVIVRRGPTAPNMVVVACALNADVRVMAC